MRLLEFQDASETQENQCEICHIKIEFQRAEDNKEETHLQYLASYEWMNPYDKYMIGTNSDAQTRIVLDEMWRVRAQAKNWIIFFGMAQIAPLVGLIIKVLFY